MCENSHCNPYICKLFSFPKSEQVHLTHHVVTIDHFCNVENWWALDAGPIFALSGPGPSGDPRGLIVMISCLVKFMQFYLQRRSVFVTALAPAAPLAMLVVAVCADVVPI